MVHINNESRVRKQFCDKPTHNIIYSTYNVSNDKQSKLYNSNCIIEMCDRCVQSFGRRFEDQASLLASPTVH